MIRVPTVRVRAAVRSLPIAILTAFLALAFVGIHTPVTSAAPTAPHFGPSMIVDRPPAYAAQNPSLAIGSDGVAYFAFAGWSGATTQWDIYFSKSSDGRTWTAPIKVNNDTGVATQLEPSLALDRGNNISIAWTDNRAGTQDVWFAKSTDGGLSFSPNVPVNHVTTNAQTQPRLAIDLLDPNLIHAVWTDTRNPGSGADIYYANSTDGGLFFNPSVRVNNDLGPNEQGQPAIAVAPNRDVYVVWRDPRNAARGTDVYFSKSTDRGNTWGPNSIVSFDDPTNARQDEPAIAVNATGTIFVAWTDYRNANTQPDIYATRSMNAGGIFAANVKVNDDVGLATQITASLATREGKVWIAWMDSRTVGSTSWDVYASSSTDGLAWSPNVKVNDESGSSLQFNPSLALDASGDVFVAWVDNRGSTLDVYSGVLDVVPPVPNAGAPVTVDQGGTVSFNGSASTDNLGIASYAWDFGDRSSATAATGSHVYTTPGVYSATLTVWDYSGNAASATRMVTVRDTQAPAPKGGGDRAVEEGQPLFFDASGSTDNVGVVSYVWTFGDESTASSATASHTYARPGVYNATLKVTDAAGNSATVAFNVTVRTNGLLGLVQILEGVVAILAIAIAFLGWMVFGRRKREQQPPGSPPYQAPPLPPREADPLDMQLPPPPRNP